MRKIGVNETAFYLPELQLRADPVENALVCGGWYDKEVIDIGNKLIKEGTTVIDCGACFGHMGIEWSRTARRVYAIDLSPTMCNCIRETVKERGIKNLEVINAALYYKSGRDVYQIFDEVNSFHPTTWGGQAILNSTKRPNKELWADKNYGGSLWDVEAPTKFNGKWIKSTALDDINFKGKISFLKMDLQGADYLALHGAKKLINKHRFPIVFEVESSGLVRERNKIVYKPITIDIFKKFIKSINYKITREIESCVSFLITPKEKDYEFILS